MNNLTFNYETQYKWGRTAKVTKIKEGLSDSHSKWFEKDPNQSKVIWSNSFQLSTLDPVVNR